MGLGPWFFDHIQNLRVIEMNFSKKYRALVVIMYSIGKYPSSETDGEVVAYAFAGTFSLSIAPVLVIAGSLFWTQLGSGFSAAEAFTTLSIITLVAQPFTILLMGFPVLWSISGCFTRIQGFLLLPERNGYRDVTASTSDKDDQEASPQPMQQLAEKGPGGEIRFEGVSVAFESTTEPVLKDLNLVLPRSSFTVITGPVGSGKSTLLKAILGEVELSRGTVNTSSPSIAYCGQATWLRNISIKDNIVGPEDLDETWYSTVVHACALNEDLNELPQGHETIAGSGGSRLSGGQKQRLVCQAINYNFPMLTFIRLWQERSILENESLCWTIASVR